jgi:hypothetical protein
MRTIWSLLTSIFLILSPTVAYTQEKGIPQNNFDLKIQETYRIELKDGAEIIGSYLGSDSTYLYFRSEFIARMEIPISSIQELELLNKDDFHQGVYWFKNPHATRYFFAPSAFNLDKGEGYYQNTYLFLNSFNVGVTNHFSIGGGMEFLSMFGSTASEDGFNPIFFLTPKLSFQAAQNFHYGFGVFYVNVPELFSEDREGGGIAYTMGTYGKENRNVTVGTGFGFTASGFSDKPIFTLCATSRFARRTAFVTENWIIYNGLNSYGLFSYGLRFFGEKIAVDLGFINNKDIYKSILPGIPYVDFTVKF